MKAAYSHKYPRSVQDFEDPLRLAHEQLFKGYYPTRPLIPREGKVVTMGSCFATNISKALSGQGVDSASMRIHEEANTPRANRMILEHCLDDSTPQFEDELSGQKVAELTQRIETANLFVFTIGVGIQCTDQKTGELILRPNAKTQRDGEWRFFSPEEVVSDLERIVDLLHKRNPDLHIVLTVSPVPLYRSFLNPSAFTEDCISKSVLRVAASKLRYAPDAHLWYWPSFELFRWVGSHLHPVYGADDDLPRHVNQSMVDIAVGEFISAFFIDLQSPSHARESEEIELVPDLGVEDLPNFLPTLREKDAQLRQQRTYIAELESACSRRLALIEEQQRRIAELESRDASLGGRRRSWLERLLGR